MSGKYSEAVCRNAVEQGDWANVLSAKRDGEPWNKLVTGGGISALHQAVLSGNELIIEHLIAAEAPVGNYHDKTGRIVSPLWDAIERDEDTIAARLIEAGADVQGANPDSPGKRPFTEAAKRGLKNTTLALLGRSVGLSDLTSAERIAMVSDWAEMAASEDKETASGAITVLEALAAGGWRPAEREGAPIVEAIIAATEKATGQKHVGALETLAGYWGACLLSKRETRIVDGNIGGRSGRARG